jgi:hypothetical protein
MCVCACACVCVYGKAPRSGRKDGEGPVVVMVWGRGGVSCDEGGRDVGLYASARAMQRVRARSFIHAASYALCMRMRARSFRRLMPRRQGGPGGLTPGPGPGARGGVGACGGAWRRGRAGLARAAVTRGGAGAGAAVLRGAADAGRQGRDHPEPDTLLPLLRPGTRCCPYLAQACRPSAPTSRASMLNVGEYSRGRLNVHPGPCPAVSTPWAG